MKTLAQKVREALESGKYWFDVQWNHPERVPQSALDRAEATAERYFEKVSDAEIEKYASESIAELGDETSVSRVLTDIADQNCDHGNYETITCVVLADEEE